MPPPNAANGRKQPTQGRIVPAIPFALTKPKTAAKQKPASQAENKKAVKEDEVKADAGGGAEQPKEPEPLANGTNDAESTKQPVAVVGETGSEDLVEHTALPTTVERPVSASSAPTSVSEATTPDMPYSHGSVRTPAPVEPASPSTTISPDPARKLADRFDMRQIKTELPPEFVPSDGKYTPQSATSSGRDTTFSSRPPAQSHHPSTNGIIFGGMEPPLTSPQSSAPSVPYYTSNNANLPRGSQQPYFQPNHIHHASEPQASRSYYPQHIPVRGQWVARQTYPQQDSGPQFQHARVHHRNVPSLDAQSAQANGLDSHSRSESQTSSAAVPSFDDVYSATGPEPSSATRPTFSDLRSGPNGPPGRFNNAPISPQYLSPEHAARIENADAIREHISLQFSSSEFSDCRVEISDDVSTESATLHLHRVILSRSPALRDLLSRSSPRSDEPLRLHLHGKYTRAQRVSEALAYLYGGPLLQLDIARQAGQNGHNSLPSNEERMQRALQYIAAGCWLKLHAAAVRGMDIAANLLHWDTISEALAFALDGGLSNFWSGDFPRHEANGSGFNRVLTPHAPTYEPYATQFLQRIVHFIVHAFPNNFYLDASAPRLSSAPRLPDLPAPTHASRPSRSDPRLSKIRFGEIPVDEHQRPSFATTIISSILLTLPFAVLKSVLEHYDLPTRLGPDTVGSVMRQVVVERESRRFKVLASGTTEPPELAGNLHWQEFVEPSQQHRAGFRLSRRWQSETAGQ